MIRLQLLLYLDIIDTLEFFGKLDVVICLPATHLGDRKTLLKVSVLSGPNWNLEVLIFEKRGKWSTRKTPRSKRENQQQTQPT